MKENIKNVLLDGKRQLLEKQKIEEERKEKELKRKSEIKTILQIDIDKRTEEFISALLRDLIKKRLKDNCQNVLSVEFETQKIGNYFINPEQPVTLSKSLNEALSKIDGRPNWNPRYAFSEDQYFALALDCGYRDFQSFNKINYVINYDLFIKMITELGLREDSNKVLNKLLITKEDLDKLLMSVHEDTEQEDTKKAKTMGK